VEFQKIKEAIENFDPNRGVEEGIFKCYWEGGRMFFSTPVKAVSIPRTNPPQNLDEFKQALIGLQAEAISLEFIFKVIVSWIKKIG
jgi:hypothetical protein